MVPLYRADPYLSSCETTIDRLLKGENALTIFCREALFMEGGGQPMDHGTIAVDQKKFPLLKIVKEKGNTGYVVSVDAPFEKGMVVRCELDMSRRLKTMRLHSAQHALAGSLRLVRSTILTGGMKISDGAVSCSVLYPKASALSDNELTSALNVVQEFIDKDCAIRSESVDSEAEALRLYGDLYRPTVASGSLKGKIRLIVIDGLDANACGGTHVKSLAHVKQIKIISVMDNNEGRVVTLEVSD